MLSQIIEDNFPHQLVSPYQLISILFSLLLFTFFINKFDIGLFAFPLWYDFRNYRLKNWIRKITFQKPYVISRPELLTQGADGNEVFDSWKLSSSSVTTTTRHSTKVSVSDLDLMFHANNARYLREADFARFEWLHKSGLFHACWFNGLSVVTASQTIRYRRELPFGCKYTIVTRCTGWDPKAIFLEHLFVVSGGNNKNKKDDEQVHAILEVREGIAVPKKMKEKYPETATAPLTWVMRNKLKWDKNTVPDVRATPKDVEQWNQFLVDNSQRITGGGVSSPLQ